jgi:hypothetical protein
MRVDYRRLSWFRALSAVSAWTSRHTIPGIALPPRTRCYGSDMTKAELHELVDALPDESLPAAAILLRRAQDPVIARLDATPYDDEELSDEELQAIRQARSEPGVPWSEAQAELNAG